MTEIPPENVLSFTGHSEEAQKFYKDAGTLAEGVVNIYLPSLIKAKAHMQELEEKQKVFEKDMRQLHEWSTKLKIRAEKIEEASRRNIQL
ncbi:hypothetical protein HHI36_021416 [Cryptolaemus montrouzieri]|uniref:Uncharacterized protein n=1 Tax=Cryptolaemus montrouzieri TaxID=559131 RepID=A0ABD2MWR2_9CUCU